MPRDAPSRDDDPIESEAETADSLLRAVARASFLAPGPAEGDVVGGNFRIEGKLGAGGMGVVYLAHDLRLHRQVALKLHSSGDGARRTEREARVLAQLVHPNVVTVHDVGTWRGRTYIAMEYLDAGTLRSWLGERPRGWREILSIFLQAARGLVAAHDAGLVHRDFKPDNVLLGSDGRVRVADFGLARPAGAVSPGDETQDGEAAPAPTLSIDAPLTATGACIGTPGFMAPEAERGGAVDARADQYSFCVALSAALAGRDGPRWMTPILERGLDADPAGRHPSLGALLDALERRLRPRRWWIMPVMIAAAAAIAVLLWLTTGSGAAASPMSIPTCPPPALPDLYVAAAAAPGGNGSAVCPFRTVTEALAVAAERRIIRIAAGRYDTEHGERFPLVVRGATELRGAGPDLSVVAGALYFDPQPELITAGDRPLRATLVIGDAGADERLSGIGVTTGSSGAPDGNVGVACTRGNLQGFQGPLPPPNTRLDRVVIGPGYETGLVVTGSAAPRTTGCNLAVTGALVHSSITGIWQVGCGRFDAAAPTALEVHKSAFRSIRGQSIGSGMAILIWDCARKVRITDNVFSDSDWGIFLVRHSDLQPQAEQDPDAPPALIEHNELLGLDHGIFFERAAQAEVVDNLFHDIRKSGIAFHGKQEAPKVSARKNAFSQNRVAVEVLGSGTIARDASIDFGRPGDPGRNLFRCNPGDGASGVTVRVRTPAEPGAALSFFGNTWDHVPPRLHRGAGARDGTDVALDARPFPAIDLGGAEPSGANCGVP